MTPQEKIKNNEFLLSLDMSDASRDQKIAWLSQIIENEIQKPLEQQDLDLIAECTEYMMELSESDIMIPLEKKRQALLETKANNPALKGKRRVITKKPRMLLKMAAAVAALLVLSFSTLTVAAKVEGYSNAWEYVVANIQRILNMEQGDSFEDGGITFVKGGKGIVYNSMDELVSAEGLDILYPAELPDDVQITKITQQVINDNYSVFVFAFNDSALSFSISNKQQISDNDWSSYEVYETETLTFYVKSLSSGLYHAIAYDEKYEYQIVYSDYHLLKSILESMKGIEQ